jgi:hypothetical protein
MLLPAVAVPARQLCGEGDRQRYHAMLICRYCMPAWDLLVAAAVAAAAVSMPNDAFASNTSVNAGNVKSSCCAAHRHKEAECLA